MGCCLTTSATTRRAKFVDQMPEESGIYGGAPPPEEETVKEVLSETQTPISVSHTTIQPIPTTTDNLTTKVPLESNYRSKEVVKEEEITVVSEMYSCSGSCSTTTAKDGDDGEVNQRMMHQSPARRRCNSQANSRGNRGGLGSLSSSNPREITRGLRSPVRLNQVRSGPFEGRKAMVQHHNVGRRDGDWTGLVERTSRKLGSHNDVIGRHRTAVSSVSGRSQQVRKVETSKNIDDDDDRDGAVSMESLENPRVSLECFIFL